MVGTSLLIIVSLIMGGCEGPENGRVRGANGGDGGNYQAGRVAPPSKIDASKDLGLISHYRPGPPARAEAERSARSK